MKIIYIILFNLAAYLIGSIPFAYIFTRLLKKVDLSKVGSKNIGATNAGRVLGRTWFFIITILDAFKGFLPVFLAGFLFPSTTGLVPVLAGMSAILGHTFSIFLRFKGGKGVAVSTGVLLGLNYMVIFIPLVLFLLAVLLTRYISLGSILAGLSLPVSILLVQKRMDMLFAFSLIITLYVIFKHRDNIKRLMQGTERKWGDKVH